jgi:hypothetical protein
MSAFDPKRTWGGCPLRRNKRHNSRLKNVILFSHPM